MNPSQQALERLKAGNGRFVTRIREQALVTFGKAVLPDKQAPFAIVLGCSDSRVPAEIIFDQSLGELFVIRVAGNIVAPSQIGSVEFAAERFGTALVVVLGHSQCGAICATLDELEKPAESRSHNLTSIVDRIRPIVEPLLDTELRHDKDALIHSSVMANIRASVNQLHHSSSILERLVEEGRLMIVGAHYSLDTGEVEFFDQSRNDNRQRNPS